MTFRLICQQTLANDWRNAIIYWHTNQSVYLTTSKTFLHTQVMTPTFLWPFEHINSIYGKRIILFIAECVEHKNKFDSFCFASAHKLYLIRSGHTPNANKFYVAGASSRSLGGVSAILYGRWTSNTEELRSCEITFVSKITLQFDSKTTANQNRNKIVFFESFILWELFM